MFKRTKDSWQLLKEAYERAQADPFFLAHDLEAYRRERDIELQDLVEYLGCPDVSSMLKLGFCRSISPGEKGFKEKLEICAQYAKACPERLHEVLKEKGSRVSDAGCKE